MSVKYQTKPEVEELITDNLRLVQSIAWHLHARVSKVIEIDDLIQIGYYGLVTAAQKYTPQEGVNFSNYASLRIRGAMVDHLRKNSNLCRTTIKMQKRFNHAEQKLINLLGRQPEQVEIADEMAISLSELQEWIKNFAANHHESMDQVYDDFSIVFASNTDDPEEELQNKDLKKLLIEALKKLPEKMALVIQLYYVEELNVYEIAEVLEVTIGRVSQIKSEAVKKLRTHIAEAQSLGFE
ncbi:MAG: FliA/WhiG family RNA polymerase sigma factor [Pseudomonadota bacterium]|nr:FliA/WhiG family RNA polymerase sigma factor [Pseudomonadota bacterium]MEC8029099.1 FliA/WhiG family RNA polymerase sigma factor [Pseudomonadota bacterium]|tara:strand:- start:137 stop:853 length:717 start_codon:yes stop_codon:yes gene_type:complete